MSKNIYTGLNIYPLSGDTNGLYIKGKDSKGTTLGVNVVNSGDNPLFRVWNNGRVSNNLTIDLGSDPDIYYANTVVGTNNEPAAYLYGQVITVSGPNAFALLGGNVAGQTNFEFGRGDMAAIMTISTPTPKGLIAASGGWGAIINSPSYSLTGAQVLMGSDATGIRVVGVGTASTYAIQAVNSALTPTFSVLDNGITTITKDTYDLILNPFGSGTLTEIQTTNIGIQMKSTDGYLRLGRTGSAGPALIYPGDSSTSIQISGNIAGTTHLEVTNTGVVKVAGVNLYGGTLNTILWNASDVPTIATGTRNTLIGNNDTGLVELTTGSFNLLGGAFTSLGLTTGSRNILLGTYSNPNLIGGNDNIFLGNSNTTLTAVTQSLAFNGEVTANSQVVFGDPDRARYNSFYFGQGIDTPDSYGKFDVDFSVTSNQSGETDKNATVTNFYINGSRGTGTGTGGNVVIRTAPSSISGSNQNTLVDTFSVLGSGNVYIRENLGIGTSAPTATLDISGSTGYNQLRVRTSYTPSSSGDTNGNIGDITWDNTYIYTKTNTGWGRALLDYAF